MRVGGICNITWEIAEKKKQMVQVERAVINGGDGAALVQLKQELARLLVKEEKLWQQRSKTHWMKEGDKNSKYFHHRDSQMYRRNWILGLKNLRGVMCMGDDNVAGLLEYFYKELFKTSHPCNMEEVLQHMRVVVMEEMNRELVGEFTHAEVDLALNQMAPLKAPGLDGMPPLFYQHYWLSIGDEVSKAVLDCLNAGKIPSDLNHSFLTLISKVKSPEKVSNFRPIALCNILYKLISKVLANRLKKILPFIISKSQNAFQADKAISDNMLVAFETLHHMQTKKSRKHGYMAMKLDMSKAYDRVECNFLIKIMERMGFHKKWVGWIYECVSTISFSIMVNGEPRGHIVPSRGLRQLRQGDPLSPYFFLLCSKGLNGLINNAMHEGKIQGYSLCRIGPKISHLFFADDSLLFCRASLGDVTTIQNILEVYETASRQQINKEKTTLFFGKSVSKEVKNSMKELLGVLGIKRYEKYLGLPAIVGKNRSASLNYIKDRVWSKLQGWKEKLLNLIW